MSSPQAMTWSRPMPRLSSIALALLLATAGCSPFPDLSELGGGAAPVPSSVDGGANADGGSGADGGTGFCASSKHTFCADFDESDALPGVWDSAGAGLALVGAPASSPPRAVHGNLPRAATGMPAIALVKQLDSAWVRTVLELDVFMAAPSWQAGDTNVFLAQIELSPGVGFFLWIDSDDLLGVTAQTPSYEPSKSTAGRLTYGSWTHLRLSVVPSATGGSYDLAVGNPPVSVLTKNVNLTATPTHDIRLTVGLEQFNTPAPALDIAFDNVTLDFSP